MNSTQNELYRKLSNLQWLLNRQRMMKKSENGPFADASRGQGRVLAALKMQSGISTKDLSYLLDIRIPSLNELLVKLEKKGYVERRPSEEDKRVMLIYPTQAGLETHQEPGGSSGIFDCLSEDEQAAFGEYLDRITAALEEKVGKIDRAEMENWMRAARARMGDEQFEEMMKLRGSFGHHDRDCVRASPHERPHEDHRRGPGRPHDE